jgi:3-hydroxyisobutyrate dehydrogenase-like beta-hydroxyacid dehydrogenase
VLVLAERAGRDLDLILAAAGDGAGSSRMFQVRGPLMVARDYDPTIWLEVFLKDLALITEFATSVGAPTPLLDTSTQLYLSAKAGRRADEDTASVAEVLRDQTC